MFKMISFSYLGYLTYILNFESLYNEEEHNISILILIRHIYIIKTTPHSVSFIVNSIYRIENTIKHFMTSTVELIRFSPSIHHKSPNLSLDLSTMP